MAGIVSSSKANNSSAQPTISAAVGVSPSNTLYVAVSFPTTGGQSVSSITDNAGGTYTRVGYLQAASGALGIYVRTQPLTVSTNVQVTIAFNISTIAQLIVASIDSGTGNTFFDATGLVTGATSANVSAPTPSLTTSNEVAILAVLFDTATSTINGINGLSIFQAATSSGSGPYQASGWQLSNPGQPLAATLGISESWSAVVVAFKGVSSGGGGGGGSGGGGTPAPPAPPPTIPPVGGVDPAASGAARFACATRLIKNAKFIQSKYGLLNAALNSPLGPFLGLSQAGFADFNPNFIIPPIEPAAGYVSVIPGNVLNQIEPVNGIGAGFFHRSASGSLIPDVQNGSQFGPVFNGTVIFVALTFKTGSGNQAVASADLNTAISMATLAAKAIVAYCQQYGNAGITVQSNVLNFTVDLTGSSGGNSFNDQSIGGVPQGTTGWADLIAQANNLVPNGTNYCLVFLSPQGVLNTDADPSKGYLGYHNISQNGMPYIFVNVMGTNLTINDSADVYELALTHEMAEMTVDPFANLSNPEVCDPCGPNCQIPFRDYFDANANYLASSVQFAPPGLAYTFFLNAIVQPSSATQCPAPATSCAYNPQNGLPITNPTNVIQNQVNPTGASRNAAQESLVFDMASKVGTVTTPQGLTIIKLPLGS